MIFQSEKSVIAGSSLVHLDRNLAGCVWPEKLLRTVEVRSLFLFSSGDYFAQEEILVGGHW